MLNFNQFNVVEQTDTLRSMRKKPIVRKYQLLLLPLLTPLIFRLLLHKHFRTFTKATITCTSPSTMAGVPDYSYNFIDGVAMPHESLTDPSREGKSDFQRYLVLLVFFFLRSLSCGFLKKLSLNI